MVSWFLDHDVSGFQGRIIALQSFVPHLTIWQFYLNDRECYTYKDIALQTKQAAVKMYAVCVMLNFSASIKAESQGII